MKTNKLYELNIKTLQPANFNLILNEYSDVKKWYERLRHWNINEIRNMFYNNVVDGLKKKR